MLRVIKKNLKPAKRLKAARNGTDDEDDDNNSDNNSDDEDDDNDDEGEEEGEDKDEDDADVFDIEESVKSYEAEMDETAESDGQEDDSDTLDGVEFTSSELPEAFGNESDEGMDDDAMFRMDAHLAKYFKERNTQLGGKTTHPQLVPFKLRVLSLLEIYLHENQGKPQVLEVFSTLAQAFENLHTVEGSEQLRQRIWGVLQKSVFKAKDCPRGEAIQFSVVKSLLIKYLELAARRFRSKRSDSNLSKKKHDVFLSRYKMSISLAQSSTFWILKIIDASNFPESKLRKVLRAFKKVLRDYLNKRKSQMKSEFLKEVFKRRPWIGHHLFGYLVNKCADASLQFRQIEALELVIEILKSTISANPGDLERHLSQLGHLINELMRNMPKMTAGRQADVLKFCGKVTQAVTDHDLIASFRTTLEPDCVAQLGDMFPGLNE